MYPCTLSPTTRSNFEFINIIHPAAGLPDVFVRSNVGAVYTPSRVTRLFYAACTSVTIADSWGTRINMTR
jgi:hypothetical protein